MPDSIHLSMINITPTMRCNLRCKLCGVLVPQYDYRPHMGLEEFNQSLTTVFNIVDRVNKLQITGGEPLLHTELPQMLEECYKYSAQFDQLWLFTNCAMPIREDVLDVLHKYRKKTVVYASDYGVRQDIANELVKTLDGRCIEYKHIKYFGDDQYFDGWVDNGDFIAHNRSDAENKEIFTKCTHVAHGGSWYIRNGQMHWCGRSIRGLELGMIPVNDNEYLDIFNPNSSIADKQEQLNNLMNIDFITACDYCGGCYGTDNISMRHPAGEQL